MSLLRRILRRRRYEADLDAELQHHMELRAHDLERSGVPADEARQRARREFGSPALYADESRDQDGLWWFDEAWRNLRFGARRLRRRPGQGLAVVMTLAACTAATLLSFGLVDAVILKPLPYPQAHELYALATLHGEDQEEERIWLDGRTWQVLESATTLDAAVYAEGTQSLNLVAQDEQGQVLSASRVPVQRVGAGYLSRLGVPLLQGRDFSHSEDVPGGPDLVIVSWSLWNQLGQPEILGQPLRLAGSPHTVIGITRRSFVSRNEARAWVPLRPSVTGEGGGTNYRALGRLVPGGSVHAARRELEQLATTLPKIPGQDSPGLGLVTLHDAESSWFRGQTLLLLAATLVLLVLGSLNVASLLVANAADRSEELRLRESLGGGHGSLLRQLLTEVALLVVVGSLAALVLTVLGRGWLNRQLAETVGLWQQIEIGGATALVLVLLTGGTTLLAGLVPALVTLRRGHRPSATRTVTPGGRIRATLVAIQVAMGVGLLLLASLFLEGFTTLYRVPPGVRLEGLIASSVSMRDARFEDGAAVHAYFADGAERLRTFAQVEQAGVLLSLPYERGLNLNFRLEGDESHHLSKVNYVDGEALEALGLPLLGGRLFEPGDGPSSEPVVIVSRSLADSRFAGAAVGESMELAGTQRRIVGVVGDVRQRPLRGDLPLANEVPSIYVPARQFSGEFFGLVHTWFQPHWVIRTQNRGTPAPADLESLRAAVEQLDPMTPVPPFQPASSKRSQALATERFQATFLGAMTALAVILAAFGLIGIGLQAVAERQREIAVRLSLGAARAGSLVQALRGVLLALTLGSVAGAVLGALSERSVSHFVYDLGSTTPRYLTVACGVFLVGLLATILPGLRIARMQIARVLLHE